MNIDNIRALHYQKTMDEVQTKVNIVAQTHWTKAIVMAKISASLDTNADSGKKMARNDSTK